MLQLALCLCKVSGLQAGHAPGGPHRPRVELALCGDLHGQSEAVVLDQLVPDSPGEVRLSQLLDGGDLRVACRHQQSEEVHATQVAVAELHPRRIAGLVESHLGAHEEALDEAEEKQGQGKRDQNSFCLLLNTYLPKYTHPPDYKVVI